MKSDDRRQTLTYTARHGINSFSLLLLLCTGITSVGAQPTPNGEQTQYARFSPSLAIIIVVLVGALFFMAFFSIYIRRCNDTARGIVHPNLSMRRRAAAAAARGLDQTVIDSFPTFKYSAVKGLKIGKGALECAVCLNEFEDDETLRLIPKCDHVFHTDCIDAWLTSHVTCPVCRADLVPQPGEPVDLINPVEFDNHVTGQVENPQNGDVSIRVDDDNQVNKNNGQQETSTLPLPYPPPRSRSVRRPKLLERFRSHSTGHSLVQPGENMDRFTLRLPDDVRKQMMRRALLTRGASSVVVLPREGSSRRGYRTGEGSSRGKTYRRLDSLDGAVKSDRWGFSRMPSFLTRAFSVRSPKVVASDGDASTSTAVKMPPDSSLPKSDQTDLVYADSARPPV